MGENCTLAMENNTWGCWWQWESQAFVGPGCAYSAELGCLCTHLTSFQAAKSLQLGTLPKPKMTTVSISDMTALSLSDVLASGLLLSILAGIMGGASLIGAIAWRRDTYQRAQVSYAPHQSPAPVTSVVDVTRFCGFGTRRAVTSVR